MLLHLIGAGYTKKRFWAFRKAVLQAMDTIIEISEQVSNVTQGIVFTAFLAFICEYLRPVHKHIKFAHGDTRLEIIAAYVMSLLLWPLTKVILDFFFLHVVDESLVHDFTSTTVQEWPFWVQLIVALIAFDLVTYSIHRFVHAYLWPYHAIHHETDKVNWSTNWRVHPVDAIVSFLDLLILFFIGFAPDVIITASFIANLSSSFAHFNFRFDWGFPLRYILMSPNFHHWHHAKKKEAVDKNFCVVFPFIDLIFGTYYCPKESPEEYGNFTPASPNSLWRKFIDPFVEHGRNIKKFFKKDGI